LGSSCGFLERNFSGSIFLFNFSFVALFPKGADNFFNTIFLNSYTQVLDQGLSALGADIKQLGSLTYLMLDFEYFD
jgi:hypothetical protein